MIERLTEKQQEGFYTGKGNDLGDILVKLGKLEDVMEKYGIESVEDLEKYLSEHIFKSTIEVSIRDNPAKLGKTICGTFFSDEQILALQQYGEIREDVLKSLTKDRDTWKKACELACECIKGKPTEEFRIKHSFRDIVDYFYQQAKEGK